ncbi:hypothetical protein FUAX_36110 [Fulvitalea axinellae]|uniref:histidine kinase n=1 Tax=Fulvitalea axinellae TaxID=1182444 RepID=A0AAU9D9D9_9BACT|nr:hypothetical protein FUAX_36110 [Fulvitalea axinellae]
MKLLFAFFLSTISLLQLPLASGSPHAGVHDKAPVAKLEWQQQEIESLKKQEQINQSELQERDNQVGALLLSLATLGALLFFLARQSYRQKRMNLMLDHKNKQLKTQRVMMQRHQKYLDKKNDELLLSNEALEEQIREKNEIIRIVAHDLRSPLNNILGLSELLAMDDNLSVDQRKYLQMIQKVVSDGDDLIQRLLDADALDQKHVTLELKQVNLAAISDSAIESEASHASRKRITVNVDYKEGPFIIDTDPRLIKQAIGNLLSNAIKFTPQGKSVSVRIQRTGEHITWEVEDQGPGISPEDRKKLFMKFSKLSPQPTGGEKSSGLGLSIVKKIIDRLGGEVHCESTEGKGSVFSLQIPLSVSVEANLVPHA